ncbi:MAG: hypothetical protein K2M34_01520 [Alphaproteobacteria bacterium]|nr:hypothetical protein [Alphaproteobacteria bacterium]
MKQQLLLTSIALALTISSPAFAAITEMGKCGITGNCGYTNYAKQSDNTFNTKTESQCIAQADSEHICWRTDLGKCQSFTDGGYNPDSQTASCMSLCEKYGYNVYVITNGTEWGCACQALGDGTWKDVGNGRERYYSYTFKQDSRCKTISSETATSQYRCKSGYYGNPSSGCTACPSNATCKGGTGTTTFICNYRYYKNGTVCTACPDSAAGGLGTLVSTNKGATADTYDEGATSITECYIDGLSSYDGETFKDSTGTFYLTDECFYQQ